LFKFFEEKYFRIFLHTLDFKRNQQVQINAVSKSYEVLKTALHVPSCGIGSYLAKMYFPLKKERHENLGWHWVE